MSPHPGRPDYDQAHKRLLSHAHDGFLALLLPGAHYVEELSAVLPSATRIADLVWEVSFRGERLLLHVELQTHPDPEIGERLAEYGLRLWRRHHLPVYSVVVYLREGGRIPESPFVFPRAGSEEGLHYRYDVVRLWEVPAERVLGSADVGLWPLAALMAGTTPETVVEVADRIARAPLSLGDRGEITSLLASLAALRLPRPLVVQLLGRNPMLWELLQESTLVQILREEEAKKAEARYLEAGIAEGRAEGQRNIVRIVLESRFGPLEPAEEAALQAADEPVLRALAVSIATDTREQVRARLGIT